MAHAICLPPEGGDPGTPPSGGSALAFMKKKLSQEPTERTEKMRLAAQTFAWLRLFCWLVRLSVLSVCSCSIPAFAITTSTQIVASVTVTNLTGITNGATFTVNGASRTWTNDPTVNPALWIATTNTTAYATTNLLINYQRYAAAGPIFARTNGGSATSFQLVSAPNVALSVAPSAGYAAISYLTNIFTNQQPVLVPLPATPDLISRTNQASGLVEGIELYATNAQTLGNKFITNSTLSNPSLTNAFLTNAALLNPFTTNLVNWGNAIRSEGAGGSSLQVGSNALAAGFRSVALGVGATATNTDSVAIGTSALSTNTATLALGNLAKAAGPYCTAIGNSASAGAGGIMANYAIAIGYGALANADFSIALGPNTETSGTNSISIGSAGADGWNSISIGSGAYTSYSNSVALGKGATTSAANQIRLGTTAETVQVLGTFIASTAVLTNATLGVANATVTNCNVLAGTLTNVTLGVLNATFTNLNILSGTSSNTLQQAITTTNTLHAGTNNISGDLSFQMYSLTTLANGNNIAVPGTNVWIKITGPSAAFAINGIANGRSGRLLVLWNDTGQAMTLAHESGVDPTPANRLRVTSGADLALATNAIAWLLYDDARARWIVGPVTTTAAVTGEANTAGNLGAAYTNANGQAAQIFQSKSGVNLNFASLASTNNVYFSTNSTNIILGTYLDPGWFGDGSDGYGAFDGSTTVAGIAPAASQYVLTRPLFLSSATVSANVGIKASGYTLYCSGILTNSGSITNAGPPGGAGGATGTAGAAGLSLVANELGGGAIGVAGGAGGTVNGTGGTLGSAANTSSGQGGGAGGTGGN